MRCLPSWVEIVAVIDADCLVDPPFLRATARHFVDSLVAFVQTPQHYLVGKPLAYCQALKYMYESMVGLFLSSRHEENAIACGGVGIGTVYASCVGDRWRTIGAPLLVALSARKSGDAFSCCHSSQQEKQSDLSNSPCTS